ncbi:TPA: hypothetical protein N0F65_010799 [Lagenidium giganteum]|uniref:Uncharacterized protein n=1 Tax=Lagenidium giganteum TaxID=4803 RepID=A0AAV2YHI2_9STRA|nr:TPA: hypothetical protein N0F65_010799 [Lagenidium giganteum]
MENRPPPTRGRTAKQVSESDADTEADSDVEEKPRVDENTCVNGGQQAGRRHGGSPMDVAIPTPETNTTEGVDNASVGSREHTGPKSDGTAVSQAEAEGKAPRGPYRGKCLYQSRKCENERAVKRNGQAHNLCEEHRSKQNQHQRKFDAKKFSRKRRQDMIENGIRMTEEEYEMETQQELYHHQQEQQRALFLQHQQRAHALRMQEAQGSDALARGVSRDTSARPPYLPPYGRRGIIRRALASITT